MRIVVDTSALIAVMVNQPEKKAIIASTQESELVAPASVKWEIGNALSSLFKRKKLSPLEIEEALDAFHQIPIHFEYPELKEALKLCFRHQIFAYDAYVLACAKDFRIPILTLDGAMKSIAKKEGLKLLEV